MPKPADIGGAKFLSQLCELPFVDAIWLYGSRARGDHDDWSDVDLAIHCPTATEEEWRKITEIAANAGLLVKVECVRYDAINDDVFREQITRYHEVLYDKRG
jgi:uncharacterized protein